MRKSMVKNSGRKKTVVVTKTEPKTKAQLLLMALEAFRKPDKLRRQWMIPKDRAAWLDFQLHLVKKKAHITYLTDREILKVILRARPNIGRKKVAPFKDPDLPKCFKWTQEQVAEWIGRIGFPQFKEAFLINHITGRKLIEVDASALSKMGLRYFDDIKAVATKIRELLQTHRPNMLRALMRRVPFEEFLQHRRWNGQTYDLTTFEKFCDTFGFPYEVIETNKCALIEPTTIVLIQKAGTVFDVDDDDSDEESEDSIVNAPSVEFTVRHIVVRNRVVSEIIDSLIGIVFTTAEKRLEEEEAAKRISDILHNGMDDLGLDEEAFHDRADFIRGIAEAMVEEVKKTAAVMKDLDEFRRYLALGDDVSAQDLLDLRNISEDFLNEAAALAVLLATGQLELENIFRQGPELSNFVDEIAKEAEYKTNILVPPTKHFINEVICQAKLSVLAHEFPDLDMDAIRAVRHLACKLIDKLYSGECDPLNIKSCQLGPEDLQDDQYFDDDLGESTTTTEFGNRSRSRNRPKQAYSKSNNFGYGSKLKGTLRHGTHPSGKSGEESSGLADDERTGDESNKGSEFDSANSASASNAHKGGGKKVKVMSNMESSELEVDSSNSASASAPTDHKTGGKKVKIWSNMDSSELDSANPASASTARKAGGKKVRLGSSGEGSGTVTESYGHGSGEGSKQDSQQSDGKKTSLLGEVERTSIIGEDGSTVKSVAHAKVYFDSTSSGGVKKSHHKKRGEFTLSSSSTTSKQLSSAEDYHRFAQSIWDEVNALKVPTGHVDRSDPDLNAGTPRRNQEIAPTTHDSQFLLQEKLRRADFAQRWAEQEMPPGSTLTLGSGSAKSNLGDRQARVVRMMADQIVSDVIQTALATLLRQAGPGKDAKNINDALRQLLIPTNTTEEVTQEEPPAPVQPVRQRATADDDDELPKMTGRDPRGVLSTGLWGWPDDKLPPAPDVRSHLRQCPAVVRVASGESQKDSNSKPSCDPKDVICFYPIFQNWTIG